MLDRYMERAVQLALDNVKEGGGPFGAVLVKDGEIVAEGVNELHKHYDISGHAELLAIRRAQQKFNTLDLSGFTMYASGEPCPMCLTAIYFSNITDVYYCQSIDDAEKAGLGRSKEIYENLKKERGEREIVMKHMPLTVDMENPFQKWVDYDEHG